MSIRYQPLPLPVSILDTHVTRKHQDQLGPACWVLGTVNGALFGPARSVFRICGSFSRRLGEPSRCQEALTYINWSFWTLGWVTRTYLNFSRDERAGNATKVLLPRSPKSFTVGCWCKRSRCQANTFMGWLPVQTARGASPRGRELAVTLAGRWL